VSEFAEVLRAWRDRLRPEEAGLPAGAGRRAPGLRREELAALAGVSVDYVVRLEQGRARHPSPQILGALARALRLTDDERDHLYRVGGAAVPSAGLVPRHIPPGVQRMIDRLGDVPLAVHSAAWDLLQWNPLWAALTGDPSTLRGIERNVAWRHFTAEPGVIDFDAQHAEEFSRDLTADLREAVGRYPEDHGLAALVTRLRAASPDFARHWREAHVARHRSSRKTATSTPVGPIEIDCDVLTVPGSDLRLVVYTVAPGSEDASKLELLRVAGGARPATDRAPATLPA
jgi:transcriptional regulator with XRE-family HTH domain